MTLTTEAFLGHMIFTNFGDAEAFVVEMEDIAEACETFEIRRYQGNRYHVARFYNGKFEAYC
jgi:hypothetical protein